MQGPILLQILWIFLFHLDAITREEDSRSLSLLPQALEHPLERSESLDHLLVMTATLLMIARNHLTTHQHVDLFLDSLVASPVEEIPVLSHELKIFLILFPRPKVSGLDDNLLLLLSALWSCLGVHGLHFDRFLTLHLV
jgi:hypothetical protein